MLRTTGSWKTFSMLQLIADGGTYPYIYTIVSQDGDTTEANILFEIATTTVQTKTTATFDYETKSSYVLIIQ